MARLEPMLDRSEDTVSIKVSSDDGERTGACSVSLQMTHVNDTGL